MPARLIHTLLCAALVAAGVAGCVLILNGDFACG
jgi:hypothetical protein